MSLLNCGKKNQQYSRLEGESEVEPSEHWRNLLAFWICGLLNNFGYVVMLSAALDMVEDAHLPPAIVLLADIFPAFAIQFVAPWFMHKFPYWSKVLFTVGLAIASFLIPALFESTAIKLIGVACASISSGFGEITFLAYSSYYNKNTVSTWSSGTGGAGILGSFSYLGLTYVLSNKNTLLVSSPLPLGIALSYFFLMTEPTNPREQKDLEKFTETTTEPGLPLKQKLVLLWKLLPFMAPLALVYFGEYLINQSVTPVLLFPNDNTFRKDEYKYYQAIYQIGVFVSRSSVNFVPIRNIYALQLPAIFQITNAIFLSFVGVFNFIPSIYIVFVIIFWEGLLGGGIYVNTFYLISQRFQGAEKEYCLAATSQSYGLSITICALVGLGYTPLLQHWREHYGHQASY